MLFCEKCGFLTEFCKCKKIKPKKATPGISFDFKPRSGGMSFFSNSNTATSTTADGNW